MDDEKSEDAVKIAKALIADTNVAVGPTLACFVACKNENFNGSEMLRSDWSIDTCLLRNLQLLFLTLNSICEAAQLCQGFIQKQPSSPCFGTWSL